MGASGAVIGIDMTPEMLEKAKRLQDDAGFTQVEFRAGYLEEIPVEDGWADVVISNGVVDRGLEQTIADGAGGAEDGDGLMSRRIKVNGGWWDGISPSWKYG